ncbi:MAG: hemolysin III family protein [Coriobacteriia bacterium]|nr:hemolysin III family protein [Coriobacteriia bacterium]
MQEAIPRRECIKLEIWNSISHGVGAILGVVFLVLLLVQQAKHGNALGVVAYAIYGSSFIFLFLMSTLYHSIQAPRAKAVLRVFDHISIFYLIAGSYTPCILLITDGPLRIVMLVLIWTLALGGTVFKALTAKKYDSFKKLSTILYIAMGWFAIVILKPLIENSSWQFMLFIVLGGLLYTAGTIFYRNKSLKYHHVIWHFFVLAGACLHFVAFYCFL